MKPRDSRGRGAKGRIFAKRDVLDREEAERMMEDFGFQETDEAGIYEREIVGGAIAPCHRRFTIVDLNRLLHSPCIWARFVRCQRARLAKAGRAPAL